MDTDKLLLISPCRVASPAPGIFFVGKKFLDGTAEYARYWPGRVEAFVDLHHGQPEEDPDAREVRAQDIPFALSPHPRSREQLVQALRGARVVNASLVPSTLELSEISAALGVPLIYTTENSLLTRKQMIRSQTKNPILRLRRELWTNRYEQRCVRAVRLAQGVQCNGTPTYEAYKQINRNPLLFFDSRVYARMVVEEEVLETRIRELQSGGPLRLIFSGRLVAIKGVDHLPLVARELRARSIPFTLDVYGQGELAGPLSAKLSKWGLDDVVRLRGFVDFETKLMPIVCRSADLFVCCHRQGDPSCTYLETMSCGTPIAGYDNEALSGLCSVSGVGWFTPLDNPRRLADAIAMLSRERRQLAEASRAARKFGSHHLFEETFRRRVQHMLDSSVNARSAASTTVAIA